MTGPLALLGAAETSGAVDHLTWDGVATITAAVVAAAIAAFVAVVGYARQQRATRRDQRATIYAQGLQAVEDYLEGPYRIRRRDGSAEARRRITDDLSDIKSRINFHFAWLTIHAPADVATAYRTYVQTAQQEAGPRMTEAWRARPTRKDRDVPLGEPFDRRYSDEARAAVLEAMKTDLTR